jgi:hypothetical protein
LSTWWTRIVFSCDTLEVWRPRGPPQSVALEGDKVDAAALMDLIRAAVALNLKGKSKP